MSLSIVQSVSTAFNTNNIDAEVSILRDLANNKIGSREVARSFVNQHLCDMPEIVTGQHLVSYKDDRGVQAMKEQDKNLSLWCVALQTTIEIGHTSYALLTQIFRDWSLNTLNVEWSKESAKGVAKKYVQAMQSLDILSEQLTKMDYKLPDGSTGGGVVVKLSERFKELMIPEVEQLREHTSFKCAPLVNQPNDWIDATTGISIHANLPLIKGSKLKSNKIAQPVLDAVNKLQRVKFIVSPHIIDAAYDILDNQHEFNSTEEELMMYREIMNYKSGEYHFAVTMDTRGRMYYRGGLLSPQGTDFCKAAFQFAEFLPLGDTGFKAIQIHLANKLGQDKLSINGRIKFINDNWEHLMVIEDHVEVSACFPKSDKFQALVAIRELQRLASMVGIWEDRTSNLVCHQDGTCNGLQHMAAITRNRQTAVTVNCVASTWNDEPQDIYGIIAEAASAFCTTDAGRALMAKYLRDMAKNPVMIQGYGAGEDTVVGNTKQYLIEHGEDAQYGEEIGKAYVAAIVANAGAVKALTSVIKSRVKEAHAAGMDKFTWTTYDGFVASTEYRDYEINRVRAGVFNALVRNAHPAPIDSIKTVGAMAPNFIHSIDATHLRMVVNDCKHDLVTVHDSIGSHPCNFFTTSTSIRENFVLVHSYNAMGNLCENMEVRPPKFRGDYDVVEALESTYIFS